MKIIILNLLLLTFASIHASCQNNATMNTTPTTSTEIIRYKVSQDDHEKFINAYTAAGKYLQVSKYCLGYELIQGEEEPDNFIVIIIWASKDEHLNGFRKSSEFGPFFNLVKPYYNNIQEMKHYNLKDKWEKETK